MKECEEERTVFLSIDKDNNVVLGKCCLYQELLKFGSDKLLNCNNIVETINSLMNSIKSVKSFVPGQTACNGKTCCSWHNFKVDTIKVNVNGCNLKCKMCNADKEIGIGNFELYFKLLEKVKGYNLKKLILTSSGEPFLLKQPTIDYLETLTENDFEEVLIITNATLLDEEDIKRLSELKVKVKIIVSNDAITKETYDNIRIGGNFEKVMQNIRLLKQYGLLLQINTVIQEANIKEIPLIEDFWKKENIEVHFILVRGENNKSEGFKRLLESEPVKVFFENHVGKIE